MMSMKSIAIIGYFKSGNVVSGGQGIKTAILTDEIERIYGAENVLKIDTDNWKKHAISLTVNCFKAVKNYKNVLFLTDVNGIKVFPKMLQFFNIGSHCNFHYYVVGGWLTEFVKNNPNSIRSLMKLNAIYVEIPSMKNELEQAGFKNIVLVNKFRRINPVNIKELVTDYVEPYRICYFSRVMREKGLEDAIEAIKIANMSAGKVKFLLDIYGAIDESYTSRFDEIRPSLPYFIRYCGIIDFKCSTDVLKDYFAMLFPTFYKSEGYPNTVVDSYAAGLPIIATRWNYNAEIIRDHKDGILVDVGNIDQIIRAMNELADNKDLYKTMRTNCLLRCSEYSPTEAVKQVIQHMV